MSLVIFFLFLDNDMFVISVPVALFISVEIKVNTLQSPKALHCSSSFVVYIVLKLYGFHVQEYFDFPWEGKSQDTEEHGKKMYFN